MQKKLYPDWYFMNVAKRQKNNNLEGIVTVAPLSLFNGIFAPYPTMFFLSTYMVGRAFYNQGYLEKDGVKDKMRMAGAAMCHGSNALTMLTTLFLGVQLARGKLPQLLKRAAFIRKD